IIVVSASATDEDQAASLAAGANAFITKPVNQEKLLQLIGMHLGLQWVHSAPAAEAAPKPPQSGLLVIPPQDEIDALYRLALIGNMRDIRQRASYLAELDERYHPFADKLAQLAKTFQSKAILELVEKHRERKSIL
ncbi:MAG: hybrid sensor histidine kinase/response regulator, partial [Pseudogulbenkiania sp.]|nr:hybrid sensor histidine kinase/response regulator [Pseudogulbenkiania sp.]